MSTSEKWHVAGSVEELLEGAEGHEVLVASDSKSGAWFERVTIGGERYVVKYLHLDDDWIMRATGDFRYRPLLVWQSGLLADCPPCIDHAFAGAALDAVDGRRPGAAILMHDVGASLIPEGDEPVSEEVHLGFMHDLTAMHASFWGWHDDIGLTPLTMRYAEFGPPVVETEGEAGFPEPIPRIIGDGWAQLAAYEPEMAQVVTDLATLPEPLARALADTPWTFLHGDWKMGNLGRHRDGRTVLIDWAVPGAGPPLVELFWYLAINVARLPAGHTKDTSIEAYRDALEGNGIDTAPWWDTQEDLCRLGAMVQLGWEKALVGGDEFEWWLAGARRGLARLYG